MLVPMEWLNDYIDPGVSTEEFCDRMIMSGSNLETCEYFGEGIEKVVVGRIEKIEPHPDADKLVICRMNVGEPELVQIVTGAPNVFEGALVPVALHKSHIPGPLHGQPKQEGGVKITKGKLRGVESYGMLCSCSELGFEDKVVPVVHKDGIWILEGDYELGADLPEALDFFSEVAPCGVIGSFLLDKDAPREGLFGFKHHYITGTLDSEVLLALFDAMHEKREITITSTNKKTEELQSCTVVPLRVLISAQNGRQHLLAFVPRYRSRISSFRVDRIVSVEPGEPRADYDELRADLDGMTSHLWGVSTHGRSGARLEHVEFTVRYGDDEAHIHGRLEREKRCGTVERLDEHTSRFSADVYDAAEMVPWIRTFICRITSVSFSDPELQKRFLDDIREMYRLYGLEGGESV